VLGIASCLKEPRSLLELRTVGRGVSAEPGRQHPKLLIEEICRPGEAKLS
jgi:hypothetical protein